MGAPPRPTLTAMVDGTSVTFGGTADVGQIAGILVDGVSYAYRTQAGDTPQLVAANLAAMARDNSIVRLSHGTLTIAGAGDLLARVVADADGATGSSPPGAGISHHLLVSDTRDARRRGDRDRSSPERPAFPRAGGWDQRQTDLRRHHGVRPIAERQAVSA